MSRAMHKLSARGAETITRPGRHSDGNGLYLVVDKTGRKKWVFIYIVAGQRKEMGLGRAGKGGVSLAEARASAEKARAAVREGADPIKQREAKREEKRIPTFGEMADQLIESMQDAWRNAKHRAQWTMTLRDYAKPLRSRPVNEITTEHVLAVLKPIWQTKPETASRLRGRIERVLDAAKAHGYRSGENPALWRGHLQRLLPARQKLTRGHHAAMPYDGVPVLVSTLRERLDISSRALEFTILTAARSGEVFGACWGEVDLKAKVWTVPAQRMKGGREHRVPLVERAVELLEQVKPLDVKVATDDLIFPGRKPGRPLSNMALNMLLRRLGQGDVTVHGFRSSLRDWAGECTNFPREVAEAALAHVVGDDTERAYRRGDALEKRRKLMETWALFLTRDKAVPNVTAISRKADQPAACA